MTATPETATPAVKAAPDPDTAATDLKVCMQHGYVPAFMPALKQAMASEPKTERLVGVLQGIQQQLAEIADRCKPPRDEATRTKLLAEMKRLCLTALQKAAPDAEARKALAARMNPAINLALECAITAAECKAALGDAHILDAPNDGQPSAPTSPRDVVAHHLPATPTQPSALAALHQLAAQAGTAAKTASKPRSTPPPQKKPWWKFWGGGNNGKATSGAVQPRTRKEQSGAKPKGRR